MNRLLPCVILSLCLTGCQTYQYSSDPGALRSVSLIDRNGMTETVSNKIRLKQYKNTDFNQAQPYQKILRIYERDKAGSITARMTSYYPNGQPKQYLEIVNSRAYGPYKEWHENGLLKLEVFIIGGEPDINSAAEQTWLFDGHANVWDNEGKQVADFSYEKGKLEGVSREFHSNGCVWKSIPYTGNQAHGLSEIFLADGSLLQFTHYCHGKQHGEAKRFWPDGTVAADELYQDDMLESGRYYNREGNLISSIDNGNGFRVIFGKTEMREMQEYRHGIPEGEVQIFGSDGKLMRKYHVKNNIKDGEELEYYEQPHLRHQPKLSISWYQGKIQGIVKTWYDNGKQESNREMSLNAKNGLSTAWYRDGSLMLIEEFEYDKLVKGEYFRKGDKYPVSNVKEGSGTVTLFDPEGNFLQKITYQNGMPTIKSS
jgi:antitoxin component YwqK of YwqJK toxin-antitoxin module